MMPEVTCFQCKHLLIEIDHYGQRLVGCIECNRWRLPGSSRVVELTEDDILALRRRPPKKKRPQEARPEAVGSGVRISVVAAFHDR
jgi:hypothetical protein